MAHAACAAAGGGSYASAAHGQYPTAPARSAAHAGLPTYATVPAPCPAAHPASGHGWSAGAACASLPHIPTPPQITQPQLHEPPSLTANLPDPNAVEKQKGAYLKTLDDQEKQGKEALDHQREMNLKYVQTQAEQQKRQLFVQIDQQVKQQEMALTQQYNQQLLQLNQQYHQQKAALEQQAMQLTMEYQQKAVQEEMLRKQHQLQKEHYEVQQKFHVEMQTLNQQQQHHQHQQFPGPSSHAPGHPGHLSHLPIHAGPAQMPLTSYAAPATQMVSAGSYVPPPAQSSSYVPPPSPALAGGSASYVPPPTVQLASHPEMAHPMYTAPPTAYAAPTSYSGIGAASYTPPVTSPQPYLGGGSYAAPPSYHVG